MQDNAPLRSGSRVFDPCSSSLRAFISSLGISDAAVIAQALVNELGSEAAVFSAPGHRLRRILGDGHAAINPIRAARSLSLTVSRRSVFERPLLESRAEMEAHLMNLISRLDREVVVCFFADERFRLIREEQIFLGTRDHTYVDKRVIIRRAIDLDAVYIVMAHNHPTGNAVPSRDDIDLTNNLNYILGCISIRLVESFVVGHGNVTGILNPQDYQVLERKQIMSGEDSHVYLNSVAS